MRGRRPRVCACGALRIRFKKAEHGGTRARASASRLRLPPALGLNSSSSGCHREWSMINCNGFGASRLLAA